MLIPSGEGEGMVNSQLVTQGNFNSPSCGLAVVVKKRIPTMRGGASRGRNLFFTTPAKPWLGELKLPFVTRWEFIIPTTRGFATCGRNYTIPSPPPEGITSLGMVNPSEGIKYSNQEYTRVGYPILGYFRVQVPENLRKTSLSSFKLARKFSSKLGT